MYKVMIVEDDVKIRTMIGVFLKKWNFESMIVETFDQVDKLVLLEKPNILLMDINLPSFDGFYWCERIRKQQYTGLDRLKSHGHFLSISPFLNHFL